jgi:hypothetical protein
MSVRNAYLGLAALSVLCCREGSPRPPVSTNSPPKVLPDIPGFTGGAEAAGPTYSRRTYTRGSDSTTVTFGRFPMTRQQYEEWLRMSRADFPQADLGVGAAQGNGFYQCSAEDPSRCNLLVQLRCGLHIEIRGAGVARRADADALLRGLDLPRLARSCGQGTEPAFEALAAPAADDGAGAL